ALATGLRGRGHELGETLADANRTLTALNPVMPQLQSDLRDTAVVSTTFGDSAGDLMSILRNVTTTSGTIVEEQQSVEALLVSAIGFGTTAGDFLGANEDGIVDSFRLLTPTTELLDEYSSSFPCIASAGAKAAEDMIPAGAKTGYSLNMDAGLTTGDDPYTYPKNLPVVAAHGGSRGKPGCYPEIGWDTYPAPHLRMNTGAPQGGPGTYRPRPANPTLVEYLFGNAIGGPGQP
ncbi:MAG: MCE family protein, partial [Rhodococcus sp. (in: high G+C Gram-positive bacteria)]|uniref:MCE family protein n=1 Tax=Rhodococcus sp. TaxID=1831 RepID=UPI003BB0E129